MKILVWGTGKMAKRLVTLWYRFFKETTVAFIDSNSQKWNQEFLNNQIISPDDIINIQFDYILIASTFIEEIIEKMTTLGVEKGKIITEGNLPEIILDYYISTYNILSKRFLLITSKNARKSSHIKNILHIVEEVDISELNKINSYDFDYILLLNIRELLQLNEEKNLLEERMKQFLERQYHISQDKVFSDDVCNCTRFYQNETSLGEENSDKIFLVLKLTQGPGLATHMVRVKRAMEYALSKGYLLVVDGQYSENMYMDEGEYGKVNSYEKFFKQPCGYHIDDILKSKHVIYMYDTPTIITEKKHFSFEMQLSQTLQLECNDFLEKIKIRERNTLGIIFRGSDYANLKPFNHYIQPTLPQVLSMAEEKLEEWGCDSIFLATEVQEAVEKFVQKFGDKVLYKKQERVSLDCREYLGNYHFQDNGYRRGADYFIAIMALTQCHSLIAGSCTGLYITKDLRKEPYENCYIFDFGRYGLI